MITKTQICATIDIEVIEWVDKQPGKIGKNRSGVINTLLREAIKERDNNF